MRRLAIVTSVTSAVLLIFGLIEILTNYNNNPGVFFGNPKFAMNEGDTVLIAGGLLTIGSLIMWIMWAMRKGQGDQR
jgi:hypothetical protein